MGVLEFFSTLVRTNITSNSIKKDFKSKMPIAHFLLDFNSIIHVGSVNVVSEINSFMRQILKNLFTGHSVSSVRLTELFTKYKMSKIQSKIKSDTDPKVVIDMFHEHFNDDMLDKLVIGRVISTVLHMLKTFVIDKDIQTLGIFIDGVPSISKMNEQRSRRYMSSIIEEYKKKILESYADYLKKQPNHVYLAERYKITWSKAKITPGTSLMEKLVAYLKNKKIQAKFSEGKPNMKIVISDMHDFGEAETKIMKYIKTYLGETSDNIVTYSPDADVILLCMLMPVKNIYVLQFHQQDLVYNLIDILTLKKNIAYYLNNHPKFSKQTFDINKVNYDIVYLSSIFGNDFIPKIESVNVKSGFQFIMDAYLETLFEFKEKGYYLVKVPSGSKPDFRINFSFLKVILHKLLPIENDFIKHNNLYNKYVKAGLIKYVFDYMEISGENIVSVVNGFKVEYGNLQHLIKQNQNLLYYETNNEFMDSLRKSIQIKIDDTTSNITYLDNKETLALLKKYYKTTNEFPRLLINLDTFSTSINDKHIQKLIKQEELKRGSIFNAYERQLYKFDHMLDEYRTKFNAEPLDLSPGAIDAYYQTYFGVKLTDTKMKLTTEAKGVMGDYAEGLFWVFSYYLNRLQYIDTWSYQHEKAPLLQHLSMFLDSIDRKTFKSMMTKLSEFNVEDPKLYYHPVEQLIYVSPMVKEVIRLLPSNYRKAIKEKKIDSLFVNTHKLVDKLYNEKVSKELDCHSIPYLNKCIVKSMHKPDRNEDKKFLKELRKVEPNKTSIRRNKSEYPDY
jgi:5'-3' exonuclease